ncbi:hypothetical protein PCL_02664 [Purpureocillium lilacinum]|uniref:Uncharacterized protein n=1 Tax=Purpureocillium lilacinum TaxID=33203 RepID=A0A2U3DZS6_PURLI|nr:hypothetical protein PCL_02664 [Purpureocillium lilacinum]
MFILFHLALTSLAAPATGAESPLSISAASPRSTVAPGGTQARRLHGSASPPFFARLLQKKPSGSSIAMHRGVQEYQPRRWKRTSGRHVPLGLARLADQLAANTDHNIWWMHMDGHTKAPLQLSRVSGEQEGGWGGIMAGMDQEALERSAGPSGRDWRPGQKLLTVPLARSLSASGRGVWISSRGAGDVNVAGDGWAGRQRAQEPRYVRFPSCMIRHPAAKATARFSGSPCLPSRAAFLGLEAPEWDESRCSMTQRAAYAARSSEHDRGGRRRPTGWALDRAEGRSSTQITAWMDMLQGTTSCELARPRARDRDGQRRRHRGRAKLAEASATRRARRTCPRAYGSAWRPGLTITVMGTHAGGHVHVHAMPCHGASTQGPDMGEVDSSAAARVDWTDAAAPWPPTACADHGKRPRWDPPYDAAAAATPLAHRPPLVDDDGRIRTERLARRGGACGQQLQQQ